MDAGVPLATIQRWLGRANISQTSTYLGPSLGPTSRICRRSRRGWDGPACDARDVSEGSNGGESVADDRGVFEKTEQNLIIH